MMAEVPTGGGKADVTVRFREEQRFRQWWLLLTAAFPVIVAWTAFWRQIVAGAPFGDDPAPDWVIVALFVVVGVGVPLALWRLRLETVVDDRTLTVGFPPFPARRVELDAVLAARAVTVRPLSQWGGYGYRRKLSGDVAFLVEGRRAVEISSGTGACLVIGSQHPDELATAVVTRP